MINAYIAYDDNDFELGEYFEDSHTDLSNALSISAEISRTSISGLDCNESYLNKLLTNVNQNTFIFIAISHGNEEEHVANEVFISVNNSQFFSNSLFYSCACSTAHQLGNILVESGCLSFIGYSETIYINLGYSQVFYVCQNFGIKSFLLNHETIEDSFEKMKNFYTEEIDRLLEGSFEDTLAATTLIGNRDCLTLIGDKTLTKAHFQ